MALSVAELENHTPLTVNGSTTNAVEALPIIYRPSAHPLLTPEVNEVLDGLTRLVFHQALERHLTLEKVEVYGLKACDEIKAQLIVSVFTALPDAEAILFWDHLSDQVENWTLSLSEAQAEIAQGLIGLEVQWSEDRAAV